MSSFKLRSEKNCLNCGSTVEENYCPNCGQENIELKENAVHMVTHTIADYFHFDNKFFKTLKPLLFKPGFLSLEYVKGKRVAYLHPIRLYIFVSIVFFIVAFSNSDKSIDKASAKAIEKTRDTTANDITEADIDQIPLLSQQQKENIKKEISKSKKESAADSTKKKSGLSIKQQKAEADDNYFERYFKKKGTAYLSSKDYLKKVINNTPKMMFVLLPLFALILKIVYIRKKRYYYEHLIYSFHVHSAFFLSFLVYTILNWGFAFIYNINDILTLLLNIYLIWYTYRSLRTFYNSSRWITVFKLFFLFVAYFVLLAFCFLGLIGVNIMLM